MPLASDCLPLGGAAAGLVLVIAAGDWASMNSATGASRSCRSRQYGGKEPHGAAATANTILLLLLSACRSVYRMAAAGQLPRRPAGIGERATPSITTWTAVGVTAVLVLGGNLGQAAAMTNAAVLGSFVLVNASLAWIATKRTH